jgi:hypothetical protein
MPDRLGDLMRGGAVRISDMMKVNASAEEPFAGYVNPAYHRCIFVLLGPIIAAGYYFLVMKKKK